MDVSASIEKVFLFCAFVAVCTLSTYIFGNEGMNETGLNDENGDAALENLYPALVQTFAIIICGYAAGRLNLITPQESKGLNTFVSTFSLPSLIFLSLAELKLTRVNWMFLLSILLSKGLVFILVIIVSFCVSRTINYGKPGLYAIFCTQSNDFAIGYPILLALYGKSHPDYPSYLYLMAPISLAILNPIAFVLMECGKQQESERRKTRVHSVSTNVAESALVMESSPDRENDDEGAISLTQRQPEEETPKECRGKLKLLGSVFKSIVTNPVVFMTVLGIIGNFFFEYLNFVAGILQVFGTAFTGTALFILGLRMVGTVQKLKGAALMLPGVLIAVKLLVLPLVTREVISILNPGHNASDTLDLSTFGFLYGTFPSAPAVFVFSTQYALEVDLISTAMVACTFVSAPLMFISAKMTSLDTTRPENHFKELESFGYDMSIAGILFGSWLILLFVVGKKINQLPHKITTFLIISQIFICIGALLHRVVDDSMPYTRYLQFSVIAFGIYGARVWTAILAVSLLLLQTRSLCFVLKLLPYYVLAGWGLPVICILIVGLVGAADYNPNNLVNPYFVYGTTQSTVTLIILLLSFFVTSGCLVVLQRHHWKRERYMSLIRDVNARDIESDSSGANGQTSTVSSPSIPKQVIDIEDLAARARNGEGAEAEMSCGGTGDGEFCTSRQCSQASREACSATLREYRNAVSSIPEAEADPGDPQTLRHVILLLLLIASMFVGIMLSIWTLVAADVFSGIYVELAFLDVTLNVGQICLTFAVFGLEPWSILTPLATRWRKIWYGADAIVLPDIEDLSFETTHVCHQFIAHHLASCERDLAKNIRSRLMVYKSCFKGTDLVEWLTSQKLTKDSLEATTYASHLLMGRVLRHVENNHHFSNSNLLFTFRP